VVRAGTLNSTAAPTATDLPVLGSGPREHPVGFDRRPAGREDRASTVRHPISEEMP
jgi:hypothetical protein